MVTRGLSGFQAQRERKRRAKSLKQFARADALRTCRKCGCTDNDCSLCVARTGEPCHWVQFDLCSACV